MKKVKSIIFTCLVAILMPCFLASCSCELEKYKAEDIQNLYKTMVENQIDTSDGKNDMFENEYVVKVEYLNMIKTVNLYNDMSDNEKNLYTLTHVYNELFHAIFRYYANWQENFFEQSDDSCSVEEYNTLYNKLNALNSSLLNLRDRKLEMEESVINIGLYDCPNFVVTSYIYHLNDAVEKSLDFVTYFKDLHITKVFKDTNISTNTVIRTMDEMALNYARLVYIDNLLPFTLNAGKTNICDLSVLVDAIKDMNSYVKIDTLVLMDTILSMEMANRLDEGDDADALKVADQYMYYSDILKQNILTLEKISANIDYYRLDLYRFGAIKGGVDAYVKTISDEELTSYKFLENLESFISTEYLELLNYLT